MTTPDMDVVWRPNAPTGGQAVSPQEALIDLVRRGSVREVLYGGQVGGGKTDALVAAAAIHVETWGEHARALLLRDSYPELREVAQRCEDLYQAMGATEHKSSHTWRFPGGGTVQLGHLSNGAKPYWGGQYTFIGIDEATRCGKLSQREYGKLRLRLRSKRGIPVMAVLASNPGGPQHIWIQEYFGVHGVPSPRVIRNPKTGKVRVFIPSRLSDTPQIGSDYAAGRADLGRADQEAFFGGNWDAYQGQVFALGPAHRVSREDARQAWGGDVPPAWWPRFRAFDWGSARPFAVLWLAMDPEGRAWLYREWYGVEPDGRGGYVANSGLRMASEAIGRRIAEIERAANEHDVMGVADPACWNRQASHQGHPGPSVIEELQAGGCYGWTRGDNNRVAGWQQIHKRLAIPAVGRPGLVLVKGAAPHLERTLVALEYDPHIPEDVDTDMEDHAPDALRYFCMMRPWTAKEPLPDDFYRARRAQAAQPETLGFWAR